MGATMGKNSGNFLDALPSQGTLHVVMLGLDSAGKTTALYRLKFDQYLNTVPTIGFNCEKVQGTVGKSKGVQFLVWDVGGQEKLRPLWRSYTRCTDGILFVVDSVDIERMEEAKMELLRTAKCPDNQGVPVLILANKQDLPGARDPKELEKLLGLHELLYPVVNLPSLSSSSSSTGNIVGCNSNVHSYVRCPTSSSQHNKGLGYVIGINIEKGDSVNCESTQIQNKEHSSRALTFESIPAPEVTTPTSSTNAILVKKMSISSNTSTVQQLKGWYIQPACAITGEGLQEGLEALYEMILRRRKLTKAYKKKR